MENPSSWAAVAKSELVLVAAAGAVVPRPRLSTLALPRLAALELEAPKPLPSALEPPGMALAGAAEGLQLRILSLALAHLAQALHPTQPLPARLLHS